MWSTDDPSDRMDDESVTPVKGVHISALYPEILTLIFGYLDVQEKGRAAQVCSAWRDAAYSKCVWRGVEAKLHLRKPNRSLFPSLVKRGIKKVQILSLRTGRSKLLSLRTVLEGIPELESLNLSGCYNVTDESLSDVFTLPLPWLTRLNMSLCKKIRDNSLTHIAISCVNLESLELGGCCNVTNTGLIYIACGLRKLKYLNLRSCRLISDQGIAHIAGQVSSSNAGNTNLTQLGLQDCHLTDEALKHLSNGLPNLKSINLSFCGSITDTGLKFLARMPQLRELNLRSCDNISNLGIAYLVEGGSKVSNLDLSFCDKVGDDALSYISQSLLTLRSLSLNACPISDEGIARLCKTVLNLDTLNIGQCTRITDTGLQLIGDRLINLRCLDLYGCTKITTVGLERIMQLPRLSVLNLGLWQKTVTP